MLYQSNWKEESEIGINDFLLLCDCCFAKIGLVHKDNSYKLYKMNKERIHLCPVCRVKAKLMPDLLRDIL